ncbi:quinolinate synthase NadA [Clostridium carnis]
MNIVDKISNLKRKRNAIILAHYYQPEEVQKIADYIGDSYYLSEIARDCTEETIIFCGVHFMAESAKILANNKKILFPSIDAGCPMAEMADYKELIKVKEKYEDAAVISYINSTALVKAHSDVIVTSSSAIDIIKNISNRRILFLPDKNLGEYVAGFFEDKEFILWDGFCNCHSKIKKEEITKLKEEYKESEVLAHPECTKEVRDLADYIGSTSGIIEYATKSTKKEFIIATEEGILYELEKKNKDKKFIIPGTDIKCIDMKKNNLFKIYETLLNMNNEILIDESVRIMALKPLENMHRLARKNYE